MVRGIGMGQDVYLLFSKDFVLMCDTEDPIELSLSLSHMYKRMWKKSEIIKKLIFLYPTVIIKHMSFIPCVTHKTSKLNATGSKMFLLKILFIKYTFKMKYSI